MMNERAAKRLVASACVALTVGLQACGSSDEAEPAPSSDDGGGAGTINGSPDAGVSSDGGSESAADGSSNDAETNGDASYWAWCPTTRPTAGTACTAPSGKSPVCGYELTPPLTGAIDLFTCQNGTWHVVGTQQISNGQPAYAKCPAMRPAPASACSMTDFPAGTTSIPPRSPIDCYYHKDPEAAIYDCYCSSGAGSDWIWTCSENQY